MTATEIVIVATCAVLLALGLVLTVRWWAIPESPPPGASGRDARTAALRALWWITLGATAGLLSGVLIVGAGGRLAMRLLAVTAGDAAQGALTEAEETVGAITVGGTFAFFLFSGIFGGMLMGLVYVAVHRWLPGGRGRGLWYGAFLMVVFATRLDPLRADNEDFDLVGPSWLSLLVFGSLGFAQGAAVAAVVNRVSGSQPLLTHLRAVPWYLTLIPVIVFVPATVLVVLVVLTSIVWAHFDLGARLSAERIGLIGRIVLVLLVLVCLPGFIGAIVDIAGRGP